MTLHLVNSLASLIVAYTALYLPLGIWILRGYFVGLDVDPEEAAMVDGATRFQAFYRIAVPQAVPGIISVAIFTFNACWNEYLYASVLVQAPGLLTLSAGLATFIGEVTMYSWTMLMAAGAVTIAPILVLFLYLQRYLVSGLSSGAVKG
jgi:ABC-type glycerol-3-phosphate transport system permease component